ncbi:hypothetical protein NM208_g5873 [Fusarium decemcellulare]|uniref:Uncharacterized protein n=1 Tax=Fusarium decemcellulare TaxID=57161 RepID=A0ACC1SFM2_9HYPO|nr:hypothetical protein NM208_g5873 [Fusarium decemcellulare]
MSTSAPPSRLAIFDSSAYEWNEEFISGQAQIYASQNTSYVLARYNIPGPSGPTMPLSPAPTAAEELIGCFLNILGDRDAPHGPSTYQDLDLRALCAGCDLRTVEEGLEDSVKKPFALLDDRCHLAHNRLAAAGHRRANPGLLNATQLLVELQKKRYNCDGDPDAERRLLYVTNPDSWAIMVLISTASSEQALCLAEFFYKYLGSKTSLGIHRPPRGVLSFSLEFHLQFYVWREKETLRQDPRKKNNDKPLRRSFQLHCLDGEGQEGTSQICIYEAQISCLIAGLDNHSWIAYLFIDTYYQDGSSSESVESYHSQEDLKTDPLAAGTVDSDLPIWTPREYFLVVYECRLKQVKHALQNLVSRLLLKLEPYIQDSMTLVPRSVDDGSFSQAQKKNIQKMLNEASRVLRQTIHSICKAVEVWDRFSSRDAAYLSDILRPRSGRPEPIPPFRVIARIGEHIDGLRDLQRLAEQQQELCAGLARELEMELVMEDNEITAQQQATGELLKTLTVISVVSNTLPPLLGCRAHHFKLFLPLTATAALFSMQPGEVVPVIPP